MSHESKIGEAVASLTARLTDWAVDDPAAKAHDYVQALLHNGWRPTAPAVEPQPPAGNVSDHPDQHIARLRQAIRDTKTAGTR